ncbi:LytR/AlgR family response regulator transcription factor [Aquimarina longa]|uniref:LytR/AlgR family response regulator transcription factor n=1 Tax=Aquimarina longa TaxID=1080221 RepID=UPI000782333D|nr:LytTR family DNA-binding domain-containing protein [Aquimarina longa]
MKYILKSIIIDDEKKDRENISLLLDMYCPQVTIIGKANNKTSAHKLLSQLNPDLVFIDIQLGTTMAFDILNEFESFNFTIVFVSAHEKYAVKGYQYNAIDYILKPIDINKLIKVVNKAYIKKATSLVFKENLLNDSKKTHSDSIPYKISITDAKEVHVIAPSKILYCSSNRNYTIFTLDNEKEIVISKNLKHFENKLKHYDFLRIHKSYLINLNHVDYIIKEEGGAVIMDNSKSLPVSKNYRKQLYDKINII